MPKLRFTKRVGRKKKREESAGAVAKAILPWLPALQLCRRHGKLCSGLGSSSEASGPDHAVMMDVSGAWEMQLSADTEECPALPWRWSTADGKWEKGWPCPLAGRLCSPGAAVCQPAWEKIWLLIVPGADTWESCPPSSLLFLLSTSRVWEGGKRRGENLREM